MSDDKRLNIQFKSTGADEALLRSMASDELHTYDQEELQKALNGGEVLEKAIDKTKLVQVQTTVNGKNGQFTRMQWKNPADVDPKKDKVVGGNVQAVKEEKKSGGKVDISKFQFKDYLNPDGGSPATKTYRKTLENVSNQTESAAERVIKNYGGSMKPYDQLRIEFDNINRHSSYRDMVSPSAEQGLKDAKKAIQDRQAELLESVKGLTKWDSDSKTWVAEEPKKEEKKSDNHDDLMKQIKKQTKYKTEDDLIDALDEAVNSGDGNPSDYNIDFYNITAVESYKGNGPQGAGTVDRIRITATVKGKRDNGETFTKEVKISTKNTAEPKESRGQGTLKYKGETISRVQRHGQTYYKIDGDRTLYSRESDAKKAIDDMPVAMELETHIDPDTNETWYEGKLNGVDVRITQETPGKDDWWVAEVGAPGKREYLKNADGDVMKFSSQNEAEDEARDATENMKNNSKEEKKADSKPSKDDSKSTGKMDADFWANGKSDPKAAIKGLLDSGMTRDQIIAEAKAQGLKWDEKEHPAMNWMRCSMAIQKKFKDADTKSSKSSEDPLKSWHDKVSKGNFTDEQKKELDYGVTHKHACVVEKDGKIKTAKSWDEADYAESKGWKNLGSLTDIVDKGKLPESKDSKPKKLVKPSVKEVDDLLTSEFPYKDGYTTVGNVDREFPGNGDKSGKYTVSVHHEEDAQKVQDFLKKIGAKGFTSERIPRTSNKKDGYSKILKFEFDEK